MTTLSPEEHVAVAAFLQSEGVSVSGPLVSTEIVGGRSNLTFRLADSASRWVLRMPPRAGRTPSAHDVAREFRVTRALGGTGVPVPLAVALCEDESVLGAPFAVAEFVDGTTVQSRADLDELDDGSLAVVVTRLVEALAALHRVDLAAQGLEGFGRSDLYAARQLKRWSGQWDIVNGYDEDIASAAQELAARLGASLPDQPATGIVHGDFRIDNTLLRIDGDPSVAAIVDWELSTIGDPVADVAMMCAYRLPAFDLIVGSPSAWTSERLPDNDQLAAAYKAAGGVDLCNWQFHLALAHYKIAVIAAGIDHRYRAGVGSGHGFAEAGEAVPAFLSAGLDTLKATR